MAVEKSKHSHPPQETATASALYVGSLEKGFRVLAAFSEDFPALGVTEIALRTGLDKSAAQRFSNTLHQLGFLEKDTATRRYRPARKLMEMAYTYLRHSALGAATRVLGVAQPLGAYFRPDAPTPAARAAGVGTSRARFAWETAHRLAGAAAFVCSAFAIVSGVERAQVWGASDVSARRAYASRPIVPKRRSGEMSTSPMKNSTMISSHSEVIT